MAAMVSERTKRAWTKNVVWGRNSFAAAPTASLKSLTRRRGGRAPSFAATRSDGVTGQENNRSLSTVRTSQPSATNASRQQVPFDPR